MNTKAVDSTSKRNTDQGLLIVSTKNSTFEAMCILSKIHQKLFPSFHFSNIASKSGWLDDTSVCRIYKIEVFKERYLFFGLIGPRINIQKEISMVEIFVKESSRETELEIKFLEEGVSKKLRDNICEIFRLSGFKINTRFY